MAVAVAGVKSKWLGRGVKEGKVLLLSLEDSIEVVLEHLDNLGAPDDDILILENPHMPQEGCYEWIQHMIIKHKPVLVIIETVIVFAQRKGTIDANDYTTELLSNLVYSLIVRRLVGVAESSPLLPRQ